MEETTQQPNTLPQPTQPLQSIQQSTTNSYQTHKSPVQKMLLLIILVVVLIILAASGYFLTTKKNPQPTLNTTKTNSAPTIAQVTQAPSPATDEIENWKTYTDVNLGVSFQYPSEWIVEHPGRFDQEGNYSFVLKDPKWINPNFEVFISVLNYPQNISLEDFYIRNVPGVKGSTVSQIKFEDIPNNNGVSIKRIITPFKNETSVDILHNGKVYEITKTDTTHSPVADDPQILQDNKNYDILLSTFKFTNHPQKSDTSNWKTYTDIDKTYTIKYPSNWNEVNTGSYLTTGKSSVSLGPGVVNKTEDQNARVIISIMKPNENVTSAQDIVKVGNPSPLVLPTVTPFTFLNLQAYKSISNDNDFQKEIIAFDKNGLIYEILFRHNGVPDTQTQQVNDQILSTFQFTQ